MCAATMSQPSSHTVDHEAFFPGGAYQISTRPWFGVVPPTRRVSTPGGGVASPGGALPAIAESGARKARARRTMPQRKAGKCRGTREDVKGQFEFRGVLRFPRLCLFPPQSPPHAPSLAVPDTSFSTCLKKRSEEDLRKSMRTALELDRAA